MSTSNSPMKNNAISQSMQKLQKIASQGRFRIKSLRVKTENQANHQEKNATQKNYEEKLIEFGLSRQFLKSLYILRSDESQLKVSEPKYQAFVRSLHQKIINTKTLEISGFNFQYKSAESFLKKFYKINNKSNGSKNTLNEDINTFISYNFSNCAYLTQKIIIPADQEQLQAQKNDSKNHHLILQCLLEDKNVVKIAARNISLNYQQIRDIFQLIINTQKIYNLDISNQSSQTMNRFGTSTDILYDFFKKNNTTAILDLGNLSLKKQGVQNIYKGISENLANPLKYLCIKNNGINEHASFQISLLIKSGLTSLDLSQNPLGPNFYLNLPSWKASTLNYLDISMTQMNSEALIFFLSRIEENKSLQTLKADQNDFSHHWFNQTKQMLQANSSVENLSMIDCGIGRFCQTFKGILHNRYLKKINFSNNQFSEGAKQLSELIKGNKVLTEIRLRFCNLKSNQMIKILKSLSDNTTLQILDISENYLGEKGAIQLIKTLNFNNTLHNLILDKMQIPLRLKRQIDQKILSNKTVKKQRQIRKLKKQNVICKKLDVGTWQDVENFQKKIESNNQIINFMNKNVQALEKQLDKKKYYLYEINKQFKQRQEKLFSQVDNLEQKLKDLDKKQKQIVKKFNLDIEQAKSLQQQEEQNILKLQQLIRQQGQQNIKRQSQLEDLLENKKYLKKKNETAKKQINRFGFDNSTALVSKKRKSRNL